MKRQRLLRSTGRWLGYGTGFALAAYTTCAGYTWLRYGHIPSPDRPEGQDALLDRFMPAYDVVERHHVRVSAPAEITFAAASEMDLQQSAVIRSIFKAREWIMRSQPAPTPQDRAFLAQMRAIGWGQLAEIPGREIVMGAVTQPWVANPVFHTLSPGDFVSFNEPNYVKIAWTLRADSIGPSESVFRTETRVATTDPAARIKFRRYWSFVSPGVGLIRRMLLGPLKGEAEWRARQAGSDSAKPQIG